MKNTVKEGWERRIYATLAVLFAMLAIMALWCRGRSFAKVLQIGSEDVGSIVIARSGISTLEITDRESIDAFMSCVNHFRYNTYFDRSHLSGCMPDDYVKLFSSSGKELSHLLFTDEAVLVYNNDVYIANSPYFADLRRQLRL